MVYGPIAISYSSNLGILRGTISDFDNISTRRFRRFLKEFGLLIRGP